MFFIQLKYLAFINLIQRAYQEPDTYEVFPELNDSQVNFLKEFKQNCDIKIYFHDTSPQRIIRLEGLTEEDLKTLHELGTQLILDSKEETPFKPEDKDQRAYYQPVFDRNNYCYVQQIQHPYPFFDRRAQSVSYYHKNNHHSDSFVPVYPHYR